MYRRRHRLRLPTAAAILDSMAAWCGSACPLRFLPSCSWGTVATGQCRLLETARCMGLRFRWSSVTPFTSGSAARATSAAAILRQIFPLVPTATTATTTTSKPSTSNHSVCPSSDRQTGRQADRQTLRHSYTHSCTLSYTHSHTHTHTLIHAHTCIHTHTHDWVLCWFLSYKVNTPKKFKERLEEGPHPILPTFYHEAVLQGERQ